MQQALSRAKRSSTGDQMNILVVVHDILMNKATAQFKSEWEGLLLKVHFVMI